MDDIIRKHRENVRHSAQKVVRRENWQDILADFFKQFITSRKPTMMCTMLNTDLAYLHAVKKLA